MDLREVLEPHAGDRHLRPGEHFGIAVLAEHVGVDVLRIHVEVAPEQRAEAGGVQHRAGADDASGGHAAPGGEMRRQVGHDVDRIGDDHEYGVGRVLQHRRHDGAEDGGVSLQELESGLARLLSDAGGDHHRATAS